MPLNSGTWRKAGGDLGDFVDSSNIRIYSGVGLRFIHKTILMLSLELIMVLGLQKWYTRVSHWCRSIF
jgi:hypothetical protein